MFHASSWTNPSYEELLGPIWPATTPRNIKFWDRYFYRWEPELHPRVTSGMMSVYRIVNCLVRIRMG